MSHTVKSLKPTRVGPDFQKELGCIKHTVGDLQYRRLIRLHMFTNTIYKRLIHSFHCSFPPEVTSSSTKEDHSAEEHDNEGEIPGPPGQAPTGGPAAAHGGQAGGVLPAELGLGAGGQHRDLHSRGSD